MQFAVDVIKINLTALSTSETLIDYNIHDNDNSIPLLPTGTDTTETPPGTGYLPTVSHLSA